MMSNRLGVGLLRLRDRWKYHDRNGPAFDRLVERGRKRGLSNDDTHRSVIDSSNRSNARANRRYDSDSSDAAPPGSKEAPIAADDMQSGPHSGLPPEMPPSSTIRQGKDTDSQSKAKPSAKGGGDVKAVKDETKALKDKTSAVKDDLTAMRDHENAHKKMAGDVGKSPKSFSDLSKSIKDSSTAQKNVQGATKSWIGTHGKLNASMLKSPVALIVAGIVGLIGVVTLIITHWGTIQRAFETVKKTVLDPVGDFFDKVFASATAGFKSVTDGISNAFSSLGSKIEGVFNTVMRQVAVIVQAIGSVLQKLNIHVPDWLGGGSFGFGGVGDAMVQWASARMATGGEVRGPGGPRDDRVPIMASNGEFVVNAASTARHAALLEAINNDTLHISGHDMQVMAVRSGSFGVPARALPTVVSSHHFDHSTTVNLITHQVDDAHGRAKKLVAQREAAASWQ